VASIIRTDDPVGDTTAAPGWTAYTLGMRHAFDADHLAAIDNTTHKLMFSRAPGDGRRRGSTTEAASTRGSAATATSNPPIATEIPVPTDERPTAPADTARQSR
jgi:High-affinity nickel-transport protein